MLDFHQAYNPPCAFNEYTTCSLPLKENVLLVKVLAGEQACRKAADGRASSRASDERASVWSAVKR